MFLFCLLNNLASDIELVILAKRIANLATESLNECINHTSTDDEVIAKIEDILNNANLGRNLCTTDNDCYRMFWILDNTVNSLNLVLHHITEHLVIREIFGNQRCRSMSPMCCSECIVDIAISIRSKFLNKLLLAVLNDFLCCCFLFIRSIISKSPWFAFLFCIETKVLKKKNFSWFKGCCLCISFHTIVSELNRNSEKF